MNLRFPLYSKILLWFLVNLLLLGGVLYAFLRLQLRDGLDSLLAGQIANRMEVLTRVIEDDLRDTPQTSWGEAIERFNSTYEGVHFLIVRPSGTLIAGAPMDIPQEVRMRLRGFRVPMVPAVPESPAWHKRTKWEPKPELKLRRPHQKFMVRTEDPVRYWVGIRLALGKRNLALAEPEVLLAVSDTLSGGGLFFDFGPWVRVALAALGFSLLFWLPLVRGITRSLWQITRATEQVAQGNFEIRVDTARRDELGRLGQAINAMTERLAGFVGGQKRFLGDAAHELCSPLARIEVALSILEARADAALQPRIADVREEAREMASLVNELLAFSKASLRGSETQLEPVALAELARRVCAREAAGQEQVRLEVGEELQALAAPRLLGRAVANLVRNALRYAGDAGPITVSAQSREGKVFLSVIDCGPGIPEEALPHIFDPFFRLDTSRSRETGGFGLGLAIVKTCVEACGGTVAARNRQPLGLQVEITLAQAD
ncbi:MAG: HAMP domain-containing sensor histidine kinase, partial [Verrucomicrobia bacterium]|nr:HAMP domain-containing sensor histidine kinase [Verrucomicrobiota bacterium]